MMVGRVTKVTADLVTVQLLGSGSYDVLAAHWPNGGVDVGAKVAIDEIKASPGSHVIVAWLEG